MKTATLEMTAQALVAPDKGILAADESTPTIEKRFEAIRLSSTEENRRAYREMLFTTPGLTEFISGVILFDETLRQKTSRCVPMPIMLEQQGIIPGIKVDTGTTALAHFTGEKMTQGLDRLRERLCEYQELGARFTKWRAVIVIAANVPTRACIEANARSLALFAALSQEAGLVPVVEPEVLMDGSHTLARCEEVTRTTLERVFAALFEHRVGLEQMLLKSNMIVPGSDCPESASDTQIATATLRCLRRTVPAAVPGIVFLSGGQSAEAATRRLTAICEADSTPWKLSFSFGRALQEDALKIWRGSSANVAVAQEALHGWAQRNSAAVRRQAN